MLKFILKHSSSFPSIAYFNTSHVEVYRISEKRRWLSIHISIHLMLKFIPSVSHTSDFFITLFFLYFQSFTDFYQPMTLYYFRYLVLHKSFVFTTLFHISCFHHLVKSPYSFLISISSNFHLYHILHFLEALLQIHSRSSVL